jgi:hypothetical protein
VRDALVGAGATVEIHADHFPDDAPDARWLAESGKRGWVVLTKDDAIRRNPLERRALLTAGVRTFIITSASMAGPEMAELLVKHLARIENLARSRRAPFIARVASSGVVVMETGRSSR